jgi:2-oxoglutarate dehydrogenase E2 component (dihydrolipoamide succinyltransferase)
MIIEVKVPTPGESISEVEVSAWLVADGDLVQKNQDLAEIESDKATLSLTAPEAGKIKLLVGAGDVVKVNSVACHIDTSVEVPIVAKTTAAESIKETDIEPKLETPVIEKVKEAMAVPEVKATPLARQKMEAENLSLDDVLAGLRKLTVKDVEAVLNLKKSGSIDLEGATNLATREVLTEPMSQFRKKLSERLVKVKNETAMLTTFNEVDMSRLMDLRKVHQDAFVKKYGYKLGLMAFFIKAVSNAAKLYPVLNSRIDDGKIVTPQYTDVSVAVQSPRGLMVPVIRNVETLMLPQIEDELRNLSEKARTGKITLEEMTGGTITVTNGGTFGSMLSTPLINPPQSAILGMHNIVDRPVAVNGKVEIRPIMYVALSYDHRIVDGKDSVGFLVAIKKMIEEPLGLLWQGKTAEEKLLGL